MADSDELSPRSRKKLRQSRDADRSPAEEEKDVTNVAVDTAPPAPAKKGNTSFKVLGNVILAMQRFKESLNPTYTYGRQSASPSPSLSLSRSMSEGGGAGAEHGGEPAQTSRYAYQDRGHRASLLLAPLPDVPNSPAEEHELHTMGARSRLGTLWNGVFSSHTSGMWERSKFPELLSEAATAFAADGAAILDNVLDEEDARTLQDQARQLFATRQFATTPNSTFVVDTSRQKTALFPKAHIQEYDFVRASKSGLDLLDSMHYDSAFSYIVDAILRPTGPDSGNHLIGQNVKVQRNAGHGGCFPIHFDTDGAYDERQLTCILYLNDEPVAGGELVLYPFGKPRTFVEPKLNRMVLFRSADVAHRVMPCFSERFCLTIWCSGHPRHSGVDELEKEKLHLLVNTLSAASEYEDRRRIRESILELPTVKRLMTKLALEDEWRQSLIESHAPTSERDALLRTFDHEIRSIRSFARLIDH